MYIWRERYRNHKMLDCGGFQPIPILMAAVVLVVHAETAVRSAVRRVLACLGPCVFQEAVALAETMQARPNLVLLEWRGREAFAKALARFKPTPGRSSSRVIVLAPDAAAHEALATLEMGADDCLRVPIDPDELAARAAAALRRSPIDPPPERIAVGPIVLDKALHALTIRGRRVELAPTEYRLLAFFVGNPDRVFGRTELLRGAWTQDFAGRPQRTVDVHVRRLRRVLEPYGCEHMIQTVRGFGYRFSAAASYDRRDSRPAEPDTTLLTPTKAVAP